MIRKSLLLAGLLGLCLLSLTVSTAYPDSVTYWCVFRCYDGTEGGGPVTPTQTESSGTLCTRLGNKLCSQHGGLSMWWTENLSSP
jgi:hypothetical protein